MSEYLPVEQDYNVATGEDELPTYDDLAEQSGPNSRSALVSIFEKSYPYSSLIGLEDGEDG